MEFHRKIDWQYSWLKIKNTVQIRQARRILEAFLLLICIGINIYLRLFPAYFPQLKERAREIIETAFSDEATKKVEALYQDYNSYAKEEIIKELVKEESKDKKKFKQEVKKEYEKLKDRYQDNRAQTYLLELDPYQRMRHTEYVLKYGYPGNKKIDGKPYDTYMLAPKGCETQQNIQFLFYLSASLYKIFTYFFKDFSLQRFLFFLPVFYTSVFLILVYIFSKKFFSQMGAFITTLFIGLQGMFIQRSCAGWYDYEVLPLIMPLLIVWFILSALKNKHDMRKLFFYSLSASFFQGLYAFTWIGWWFIFLILNGFFIFTILDNYFIFQGKFKKANSENFYYLTSWIVFIIGSIIFCFLIAKTNLIYSVFILIKDSLTLGKSFSNTVWPNVYYTVGELIPADAETIINNLYGEIVFILSLLSVCWFFIRERRGLKKDVFYILFFWFVFFFYASFRGTRFIINLAFPLGFFFGGFISEIYLKIKGKYFNSFKEVKLSILAVFFLALFLLIRVFFLSGFNSARHIYPLMNDEWAKALTYLKENTQKESIVNSWWDYGDLFKAISERKVIFDGQSQNKPFLYYWMARAILTKDEYQAIRILKMLNNSSDTIFYLLNKFIPDNFECTLALEKLLSIDRSAGESFLLDKGVVKKSIDEILDDLHNKPSAAYFIVESSMVDKMGAISFLGNWDFKKSYIKRNISKKKDEIVPKLKEIFSLTTEEAKRYYGEIVITPKGVPTYEGLSRRDRFYNYSEDGKREGNSIYFDSGLLYNLETRQAIIYSLNDRRYYMPKRLLFFQEGEKEEIKAEKGNHDRLICLFKWTEKYNSVALDEPLVSSLFFKLYFLKGHSLKYFEPFYADEEAKIYIYRIKWE